MFSKLKIAKLLILTSFIFSCYQVYIRAFYYEDPISKVTFLGPVPDKYSYFKGKSIGNHIFGDLHGTILQSKSNNPYLPNLNIYRSNYPPFAHILVLPILKFQYLIQVAIFQVVTLLSVLGITYLFLREKDYLSHLENFLIFGFCLYPTQFLYDRGNLESLAFLFTGFFVYSIQQNHFLRSSLYLGTAAAIKITPLGLILILVFKRKWKATILSILAFLALCYISFEYYRVYDKQVFNTFYHSIRNYSQASILGEDAVRANSSLYALFKSAPIIFPHAHLMHKIVHFLQNKGYLGFLFILYGSCLVTFFLNSYMKFWEVVTVALFLLMISQPSSFDYRLIHLLIPFFLIIRDTKNTCKWSWLFAIIFILIFWPKNLFFIGKGQIGVGSFLNPLLMLLGIILIQGKYLILNFKSIFLKNAPEHASI